MLWLEQTQRKYLNYQQAATFTYPVYNRHLVWVWTGAPKSSHTSAKCLRNINLANASVARHANPLYETKILSQLGNLGLS